MKKYRIIFEDGRYYRIQKRSKNWFSFGIWKNCEYFYEEEKAKMVFNRLVKFGHKEVIEESDWIK